MSEILTSEFTISLLSGEADSRFLIESEEKYTDAKYSITKEAQGRASGMQIRTLNSLRSCMEPDRMYKSTAPSGLGRVFFKSEHKARHKRYGTKWLSAVVIVDVR